MVVAGWLDDHAERSEGMHGSRSAMVTTTNELAAMTKLSTFATGVVHTPAQKTMIEGQQRMCLAFTR
jgi:hypothetical protein